MKGAFVMVRETKKKAIKLMGKVLVTKGTFNPLKMIFFLLITISKERCQHYRFDDCSVPTAKKNTKRLVSVQASAKDRSKNPRLVIDLDNF